LKTFQSLIKRIATVLGNSGLEYAFTGAIAVSFYGVPRTTVDIDIILRVSSEKDLEKLVSALKDLKLKVGREEIVKALESGYKILTVDDEKTPYSIDIIFSEKRLRRRKGMIAGVSAFFQDPEDLVLAKLRMIKATLSKSKAAKDIEDVKGILKFTRINLKRVRVRAKREKTLKILEEILAELD